MELRDLVPVEVKTLDKTKPIVRVTVSLQSDGTLDSEDVHKKVCQALGLEDGSYKLFSLFEGSSKLTRRIKDIDDLPNPPPELWLRKWCFNQKQEKTIIDKDMTAAHLVFCEAQDDLEIGRFSPTKEQLQKLDEYSDPGFPLARQFVTLCHSVKNYFSVAVKQCAVCHGLAEGFVHAQAREKLADIRISFDGLILDTGQCVCIPLYCISKWSAHQKNGWIQYHYISSNTTQTAVISLVSQQALYLMAATNEIVKEFQDEDTCFYSDMITTSPDGATVWENAIFDLQKAKYCPIVFPL